MSCSYSTTQWCGRDSCRDDDKDVGADKDVSDLRGCNAGYTSIGYRKFDRKRPFKDQFLRICSRNISGSTLKCASGQRDSLTCANKYCRHSSPASIPYMINYCVAGGRIFTSHDCKVWGGYQKDAYTAVLKDKCNNVTNLKKPQCQEYCRSNPGQCPIVVDFCSIHPTDPLCSCLKSPLNEITGSGAPPASCFDNNCMQTGYHSTNMVRVSKNCPNYIDCKQIITAQKGAILNNVNIQQKCSIEIAKDLKDKKTKTPETDNSSIPKWKKKYDELISIHPINKIAESINKNIPDTDYVIGGIDIDDIKPLILLFILIIILVVVLYSNSSNNTYGVNRAMYRPPLYY
jgi:hypothetical protein